MQVLRIGSHNFVRDVATCERCRRPFDVLIDVCALPTDGDKECPGCAEVFPDYVPNFEYGKLGGPVLLSMMVVDMRQSKLFPSVLR